MGSEFDTHVWGRVAVACTSLWLTGTGAPHSPTGLGRTRGKVAVTEVVQRVRGSGGSAGGWNEPSTRGWRAPSVVSAVGAPGVVLVLHVVAAVLGGFG